MTRKRRLPAIAALGKVRPVRLSDVNLKTLHSYLCLALMLSNDEMKRRALNDGKEMYIRIIRPE